MSNTKNLILNYQIGIIEYSLYKKAHSILNVLEANKMISKIVYIF